jgi:hypothetical protein
VIQKFLFSNINLSNCRVHLLSIAFEQESTNVNSSLCWIHCDLICSTGCGSPSENLVRFNVSPQQAAAAGASRQIYGEVLPPEVACLGCYVH